VVVDTSAIVAILFRESDAGLFERSLAGASTRLLSAVAPVELSCVVEGRKG
jgi:ribonuclease VapC